MRAASTAASTVCSGTLREYSTWWALAMSSARIAGATPAGCVRSDSTAGASRRYQRSVPSAMARTAERSAPTSCPASAASAERPRSATAATTRAAPASAGAPGAQRVLAKAPACQRQVVGELRHFENPSAGLLDASDAQEPPGAAHNQHEAVLYADDGSRCPLFRGF